MVQLFILRGVIKEELQRGVGLQCDSSLGFGNVSAGMWGFLTSK